MMSGDGGLRAQVEGEGRSEGSGEGEQQGQEHHEDVDDAIFDELIRDIEAENADEAENVDEDVDAEDQWRAPVPEELAPDAADGEPPPPRASQNCPIAPSQNEFDDHCRRGHVHYRTWCPICVGSRGREDPHKRAEPLKER